MFHKSVFAWALAASLMPVGAAHAGMYAQDLAKCMVSHMTKQDQAVSAHFIFSALSNHPSLKSMSNVTEEQQKNAILGYSNQLIQKVTVTCRKESLAAVKYEGPGAIGDAFMMYGAVLGRILFSDPGVVKAMSALAKCDDDKDIKALVSEAQGSDKKDNQATDSTGEKKAPPAG